MSKEERLFRIQQDSDSDTFRLVQRESFQKLFGFDCTANVLMESRDTLPDLSQCAVQGGLCCVVVRVQGMCSLQLLVEDLRQGERQNVRQRPLEMSEDKWSHCMTLLSLDSRCKSALTSLKRGVSRRLRAEAKAARLKLSSMPGWRFFEDMDQQWPISVDICYGWQNVILLSFNFQLKLQLFSSTNHTVSLSTCLPVLLLNPSFHSFQVISFFVALNQPRRPGDVAEMYGDRVAKRRLFRYPTLWSRP